MRPLLTIVRLLLTMALLCAAGYVASAQPSLETQARTAAIRATIQGIEEECRRYAKGDWNQWYAQLADFRANLKTQIEAATARLPLFKADPTAPNPLLRADLHPPIFEWRDNAYYLVPDAPEKWAEGRPSLRAMIRVSQWLRGQGVDLLVVPVPRIAEVYGDTMAKGAPPDKILAPHMRRLLFELSKANVEVVDLLPVLLKYRDTDPEALYLYTDGHWSDRAQRIAAQEIAKRLNRYAFVKKALAQKPLFRRTPTTMPVLGSLFVYFNAGDKTLMSDVVAATRITKVATTAGVPFEEPEDSPVVVIGDSFTHVFQLTITKGSGIDALLSSEINIPVSNVSSAGATTGPIKEFLRRPELLANRKVVIWIVNNSIVSYDSLWDLPDVVK